MRACGGLLRHRPRPVRAVDEEVAVLVEDVVDDLEEEAELVAERPPRRLLRLGHPGGPERAADRRREQPPVFSRCSVARVVRGAVMSRYWPPIMPSVAYASSRATSGVR